MSARPWKKYKLDNGDEITVKELAKKLDISQNSARVRLCKFSDPEKIYKKADKNNHCYKQKLPSKNIQPNPKYLKNKPIYDPMFKLAMKAI